MSDLKDMIGRFHEDRLVNGTPDSSGLDPQQSGEFDLLSLIWEESGSYSEQVVFDGDTAWSEISEEKSPADLKVVSGPPNTEEKPKARVIPLRRYAMAAAAVLAILVIGSRVLLQEDPAPYRSFPSPDAAREYAYNNLMPLAQDILARAQSEDFENKVYEMAGQRFDGETNVLIQDLADEMRRPRFRTKLAAFRNIDGNNYYPQVFIPDYEDYYEKDGEPVVVIYVTDQPSRDGSYSYIGYKYENGGLVEYQMIDEQVLQQERVWVISINENVDNVGELPASTFDGGQMVSNGRAGRIDRLAVFDAKESWAGGASELRIRGVLESWNGLGADGQVGGRPTVVSTSKPTGMRVKNIGRNELGNELEIDYPLHFLEEEVQFLEDEVQLAFVLFEADVWPNEVSHATYRLANGEQRMFKYCSAQEHYDVGSVFTSMPPADFRSPIFPTGIPDTQYISLFSRQNPAIRYNTEIY